MNSNPIFAFFKSLQTLDELFLEFLFLVLKLLFKPILSFFLVTQLIEFRLYLVVNSKFFFIIGQFLEHCLIQPGKSPYHVRLNGKLFFVAVSVNFCLIAYSPWNSIICRTSVVWFLALTLKLSWFKLTSMVWVVFQKLQILFFYFLLRLNFVLLTESFHKFILFFLLLFILKLFEPRTSEDITSTWNSEFQIDAKLQLLIYFWR